MGKMDEGKEFWKDLLGDVSEFSPEQQEQIETESAKVVNDPKMDREEVFYSGFCLGYAIAAEDVEDRMKTIYASVTGRALDEGAK